jgi:hypothetical protein
MKPVAPYTLADAERARAWGCNCGPSAIAAITGKTLEQVRPYLLDFERKGYTNPTLMYAILNGMGVRYRLVHPPVSFATWGLVRVQWEGPWTAPGVPVQARYRHTHWIGSCLDDGKYWIFDCNAICVGGWIPQAEWTDQLVPWLLRECQPKADGRWHITHRLEVDRT